MEYLKSIRVIEVESAAHAGVRKIEQVTTQMFAGRTWRFRTFPLLLSGAYGRIVLTADQMRRRVAVC